MKIDLPLENWVDVFWFLSRLQLMRLIPHIDTRRKRRMPRSTIGDRQFVSFIQFYLHKCGEVTLGLLEVRNSPRNGHDHPIVKAYKNHRLGRELPLADVPISENIEDFEQITLNYFDDSVLRFLQEFQQNSLLTNVKVRFAKIRNRSADVLVRIMTNVMPLLTSIDSIAICTKASANIQRLFQNNEYSALTKKIFGSTRFLYIWDLVIFDWYFDWLYTPREDGQPRFLKLHSYHGGPTYLPFVERVKKDFIEAKETASSFFVYLRFHNETNVQSVTLDNGKTHEELVITQETFGISISRYPIGANEKWIEEMKKEFFMKNLEYKKDYERRESLIWQKITIRM